MKKLMFIFLASTTFAALPPLAQSTREIKTLLADPQFYASLGSAEQIKSITHTEHGYLVLTQNYAMNVDVKYGALGDSKLIGPAQFQLEFNEPTLINSSWSR